MLQKKWMLRLGIILIIASVIILFTSLSTRRIIPGGLILLVLGIILIAQSRGR